MHIIPFTTENFSLICDKLSSGEVFIFPSDTSYGFSASPFSQKAIHKIQKIKQRPATKPFLLLVSDVKMAEQYGIFSQIMKDFAQHRWKEEKIPTTALVPKTQALQDFFSQFSEIGIRVPIHSLLRKFLKYSGKPLISTSANISGEQAIYSEQAIQTQFKKEDICFCTFGDLPLKPPSQIWKEGNTKLVRVR